MKSRKPGWKDRQKRGSQRKVETQREWSLECEIGALRVTLSGNTTKGMKTKQRVLSWDFQELQASLVHELSYRKATFILNRMLHREAGQELRYTTLKDWTESFGQSISRGYIQKAETVLEANGFDKESGQICQDKVLAPELANPNLPPTIDEKHARQLIADYNRDKATDNKIKYNDRVARIESSAKHCCYISADDVGVKFQKESRSKKSKKNHRYLENTVIHIQTESTEYTLTAIGMDAAFKQLLAFLLASHILENHRLIFMTDGATNIKDHIEKFFSFCQYTIILDWLHLEKKCNEYLSMALKGNKDDKAVIKKQLAEFLWIGHTQKAVRYISDISSRSIRRPDILKELVGYLERKNQMITCYALRKCLGLRNSSNRVEKENDLIVASRQKHNGMSWSKTGSGALASIAVAMADDELSGWIEDGTIRYGAA